MEAQADGATPSSPGVCGRHGGRGGCAPGRPGIVRPAGRVAIGCPPQTQGWDTGHTPLAREPPGGRSGASHREGGPESSGSAGPAEAGPDVGAGRLTQARGQTQRPWIVAGSRGAAGPQRPGGGEVLGLCCAGDTLRSGEAGLGGGRVLGATDPTPGRRRSGPRSPHQQPR
jgi:hypothetical protein